MGLLKIEHLFKIFEDTSDPSSAPFSFKIANNNTKYNLEVMKIPKFGDPNKWSPADIYYASNKVKDSLAKHLSEAQKDKTYSFDQLNLFISKQIDSGDLLPLSLKKATTSVIIKKVNFDIDYRTKLIDGMAKGGKVEGGLWHAKNQKTSTGFQSWKMYPKGGLKKKWPLFSKPANAFSVFTFLFI